MVLDASLLNTQHYKVRIKGKVEQSREGVAPSPTPWCSSYRKGSLRVTLDYGRLLFFYCYYHNVSADMSTGLLQVFGKKWRGTPHSPKLQPYWNLTIRLFSIIYRTYISGGILALCCGAKIHLSRGVRSTLTSVQDIKLNNMMVRFQ